MQARPSVASNLRMQATSEAVLQYVSLLEEERDAARLAEVDRLVGIQEKKREVLDVLLRENLSEDDRLHLQRDTQRNVRLIRQLVQCLEGMLTYGGKSTYDAAGQRNAAQVRGLRGTL